MSRGKPVVGTFPGGHTDMITDGVDGLLVGAGDLGALAAASAKLAGDPALCTRLGDRARSRGMDFTADVIVPKFEQLYRSVLESS